MSFIVLLVGLAVSVAAYLLTPKARNPRPDIAGVKPPSTQVGQPIPVVFGTMKLPPMVCWWGNARAQQYSSNSPAPGSYKYGFDFEGVFCMGPVDAILDYTVDDHSLVQYTQERHYLNAFGDPVTNTPILVQYLQTADNTSGINNPFPLRFGTFPAGFAHNIIDAPLLLGGPESAGGLSQVWFDWFLGGPGQVASATMARLIGNVLASAPTGTPVPQPVYTSLCYVVSYQDPNPDNIRNSGYYGESPIPPNFAAVIQRCPKTLSTALGHPEYAIFSTYDANPVEALYSALTSQEFAAGLKPLLQIPMAGIDVTSFETACATVYTEALIGSNPGPPIARSYLSNNVNKGDGTFSNIAGALGAPTEIITVTFTSATAFTVTGSVSGAIGSGTTGTPFTSAVISFTITPGVIAFVAGDYFQFFVTQIASAGISDAIGVPDATAAEEWIRGVLTAIDGVLFTHPETSLLTLKLVRSDYTLADQPLVDESVYDDSLKYVEGSWPQTYNEVSVRYRNRGVDYTAPVTAAGDAWAMTQAVATIQNIAALQANGGIPQLAEPLDLPMLTNGLSAAVCAARALRTVSVPRAKASWLQNRTGHAFTPGMVVRLSCKRFGISQKAMRITSADYGTLENGKIRIEAVEDSFVTRPPIFDIGPVYTGIGGAPLPPVTATGSTITLAITPSPVTIQVGQSITFTVTATSAGAPVTDTFAFTTADATIATVNGSGTATGVAVGTVNITVYDPSGNRATAVVNVVAATSPVLTSVSLTPATATVAVGGQVTYVLTGKDQFGAPYAITPSYSSGTTGVGTINGSSGVGTGVAVGTSVITGSAGGLSATATLTVATAASLAPPGDMVVLPSGVSLVGTLPALAGGGSGLSIIAVKMRFLVDALLASSFTASGLVTVGSGIEVSVGASSGTLTFSGTFNGGVANAVFGTMAQSALPAAGTGVILYAVYEGAGGGTGVIELMNDAGTALGGGALTGTALGASGNTNSANTAIAIGGGTSGAGGLTIDGVEIAAGSIAAPSAVPSLADANQIEIITFDGETLNPVSGVAVAPSSGSVSYIPGGLWGVQGSGSPVLSGLVVSPSAASIVAGATVTESASGIDQFDNPITDPNTITWASSNTAIATVNSSTGVVTGVSPGIVTVTATDATLGKSATATVTVNAASGGGGSGGTPGVPTGKEVGFATDINGSSTPGYGETITIAAPGGIGVESVASQLKYIFPTATSASTPAMAPASMDAQLAAQLAVGNINELYTFQLNAASPYDVPWYQAYIVDITTAKAAIVAIATAMMNRWKDSVAVVNAGNEAMLGGGYCNNAFRDGWIASSADPDDYTTGVIPFILNTFNSLAPTMPLMLNFGHLNTDPAQRAGVLALYTGIKATNTPASVMLNRVGDEHHDRWDDYQSGLLASQIPAYTTWAGQMDALGVDLDFTEMDYTDGAVEEAAHAVPGPEFPADYPTRDSYFAQIITLYGNFRKAISNAGRWLFWGLLSERSWLNDPPNAGTIFNRTDGQRVRACLLNNMTPTAPAAAFLALYPTLTDLGAPALPPPPTSGPNVPGGMTTVVNTALTTAAGAAIPTSPFSTNGVSFALGGSVAGVTGTVINSPTGSAQGVANGLQINVVTGHQNDPAIGIEIDWTAVANTGKLYLYYELQQGATGGTWNPGSGGINSGSLKMWAPKDSEGNDHIVMGYGPSVGNVAVAGGYGFGIGLQGPTTQNVPDWNTAPFTAAEEFFANIPNTFEVTITPNSSGGASDGRIVTKINGAVAFDSGATLKIFSYSGGTPQWDHLDMYLARAQYSGNATAGDTLTLTRLVVAVG